MQKLQITAELDRLSYSQQKNSHFLISISSLRKKNACRNTHILRYSDKNVTL